ncbi:hypothetical protein HaLaN_30679 [Haematococcus lacustris]|uniref:NERD domain-containing protein n=1 Tax=Haematococcus lacustris TaxID=44745 RepID=A0A6A0AHV2_HAELA|nr:hypothetical protein HaLaN_30679 [Haematococcus lacustris]
MQQCMRTCHHNVLSRRLKHIHVLQTRKLLHAACMASESTPASGAAAGLSQYMTRLTQDEQADALSKFVAAGYTDAMHDLVTRLGNQELAEIGIQPQAVRSALRRAFALTGPGKTIVIMDSTGAEEVLQFDSWKVFETWSRSNILKQLQQDGTEEVIVMWEQVQEGGMYYTDKTLDKKVGDMEGFESAQSKSLKDEVAERALADMRQQYPDASRLCKDVLKDKSGQTRQYDGIIVAENCVKVVEPRSYTHLLSSCGKQLKMGQLTSSLQGGRTVA